LSAAVTAACPEIPHSNLPAVDGQPISLPQSRQGNAMVDLAEYAHSLESDLAYVRGILSRLQARKMRAGLRAEGKEWVDFSAQTILLYKRMIVTYEAALIATKAKIAAGEAAGAGPAPSAGTPSK
jgi:hypothetical protein